MAERRPKNSELRLRRLSATEESEAAPRGILEIFPDDDEQPADADAALTRSDDDSPRQ